MEIEGYEYGVQYFCKFDDMWKMCHTNHFHGWYPSRGSARNALAQLKATRYGRRSDYQFRLVKRPHGATEVVE